MTVDALRLALLRRRDEDVALRAGPVDARAWQDFDTASTALLRRVIAAHGWPGTSLVGRDGAEAAWLLAQHSPDVDFQQEVLERLRALPPGEIEAGHLALLHDRICIRTDRPQRYGSQVRPDGRPFDLEPGDVDARRAAMGLEPLAVSLARFRP